MLIIHLLAQSEGTCTWHDVAPALATKKSYRFAYEISFVSPIKPE